MGAGRTELLEALAGPLPPVVGPVVLDGAADRGDSIAERIARGLALVPEDRQRDGLVQPMSVGAEPDARRACGASSAGRACRARARERDAVEAMMRDVTVKAAGPGRADHAR